MYLIPAYWISITSILAGIGWLLFSRSQEGRFHANVLPWLSLPFFTIALVYLWFSFVEMDIETRATFARWGFVIISVPHALVLIVLYIFHRGAHGKPE